MLMTAHDELTPLARRLIQAVKSGNGKPMTRAQIADDLKRPRNKLHPYDVELLEMLVSAGYLAAEDITAGAVKTVRQYTPTNKADQE